MCSRLERVIALRLKSRYVRLVRGLNSPAGKGSPVFRNSKAPAKSSVSRLVRPSNIPTGSVVKKLLFKFSVVQAGKTGEIS